MTPKPTGWDELHLAENPAVEMLESLGYTYVSPEELDQAQNPKRAVRHAEGLELHGLCPRPVLGELESQFVAVPLRSHVDGARDDALQELSDAVPMRW